MIYIFDLDDTLYPEVEFAKSGFQIVAQQLSWQYGIDARKLSEFLLNQITENQRYQAFQNMVLNFQLPEAAKREALSIYRSHRPVIELYPEALELLEKLQKSKERVYIVTDGNKKVQANKVRALMLENYVQKTFITHQYGVANAKPSLHCFKLIQEIERRPWNELTYVGDNPTKDFVALNQVGGLTIQVNKGPHLNQIVPSTCQAKYRIDSLEQLLPLLKQEGFR